MPRGKGQKTYGSIRPMSSVQRLLNWQNIIQVDVEKQYNGDLLSKSSQAVNASPNKPLQSSPAVKTSPSMLKIGTQLNADYSWEKDMPSDCMQLEASPSDDGRMGVASPTTPILPSHIVDIENDEEASSETEGRPEIPHDHVGCQCDTPFFFFDLEPQIRRIILKMALRRDDAVEPYYNEGTVEQPENKAQVPDIDISLLLVNKQLYLEASDVLYGENTFELRQPHLALWWLKRVGSNLSKIRNASFSLGGDKDQPLGVLREKLWLNVFVWLRPRHKLHSITITFPRWHGNNSSTRHDQHRQLFARTMTEMGLTFLAYRGLGKVKFNRGGFCTAEFAMLIHNTMRLKVGETTEELEDIAKQTAAMQRPPYRFRR